VALALARQAPRNPSVGLQPLGDMELAVEEHLSAELRQYGWLASTDAVDRAAEESGPCDPWPRNAARQSELTEIEPPCTTPPHSNSSPNEMRMA
jgi:hypothetical protein